MKRNFLCIITLILPFCAQAQFLPNTPTDEERAEEVEAMAKQSQALRRNQERESLIKEAQRAKAEKMRSRSMTIEDN